jgi:tricorn protease
VVITPQDRLAGRDPQLDKAIEVLMTKLEEDPRELPEPPPWPVRGQTPR